MATNNDFNHAKTVDDQLTFTGDRSSPYMQPTALELLERVQHMIDTSDVLLDGQAFRCIDYCGVVELISQAYDALDVHFARVRNHEMLCIGSGCAVCAGFYDDVTGLQSAADAVLARVDCDHVSVGEFPSHPRAWCVVEMHMFEERCAELRELIDGIVPGSHPGAPASGRKRGASDFAAVDGTAEAVAEIVTVQQDGRRVFVARSVSPIEPGSPFAVWELDGDVFCTSAAETARVAAPRSVALPAALGRGVAPGTATAVSVAAHYGAHPGPVAHLLTEIVRDFTDGDWERGVELTAHVVEGALVHGRCAVCTVDQHGDADVQNASCGHPSAVAQEAAALKTSLAEYRTTGVADGVSALSAIQLLTGVFQLAEHGDRASALSAVLAVVRVILESQRLYTPDDHAELAGVLVGEIFLTTGWTQRAWNAATSALLAGDLDKVPADSLPHWLAAGLVVLGKILGLSTVAGMATLLPKVVMRWAKATKIHPGQLVAHVLTGAEDLMSRLQRAWVQRDAMELFRVSSADDSIAEAMHLMSLRPNAVPGEGRGIPLAFARLRLLSDVLGALCVGRDKALASSKWATYNTAVRNFETFVQKCRAEYFGPSRRVRPTSVLIYGRPGVGKTPLTRATHQITLAAMGMEYGDGVTYARPGGRVFYDGIDPSRHVCADYDDFAQSADVVGDEIQDVLCCTGEAPYTLPIADVNEMNRHHAAFLSIVVNTNDPECGVQNKIISPAAFHRRFAFKVILAAHPTAQKLEKGSTEINPEKLATMDENTVLWAGMVVVPVVTRAEHVRWDLIGEFTTLKEYVDIVKPLLIARAAANARFAQFGKQRDEALARAVGVVEEPTLGPEVTCTMAREVWRCGPPPEVGTTYFGNGSFAPCVCGQYGCPYAGWHASRFTAYRLFWGEEAHHSAASGAMAFFAAWALSSGALLAVAAAYAGVSINRRFWERVDFEEEQEAPGATYVLSALDVACKSVGWLWFLPPSVTMPVAFAFGMARARLGAVRWRRQRIELWTKRALVAAGVVIILKEVGKWMREKGAPPDEAGETECTSEASYADVQRIIRDNPTNWQPALRSELLNDPRVIAKAEEWRARAAASVVLGAVKPDLLPRAMQSDGLAALRKAVTANTFQFQVCDGATGDTNRMLGMFIGNTWMLVPYHAFIGVTAPTIRLVPRAPEEQALGAKWLPVTLGVNAHRLAMTDLVLVNFPTAPRQSLYKYFAPQVRAGMMPAGRRTWHLQASAGVVLPVESHTRSVALPWSRIDPRWPESEFRSDHVVTLAVASVPGTSGSVVVASVGDGATLLGSVTGNYGGFAAVDMVSQEMLAAAIAKFTPVGVVQATGGLDISGEWDHERPPHQRSWLGAYQGVRHFLVVGLTNERISARPRWKPNPLREALPALEQWAQARGGGDYAVPAMKPFVGVTPEGDVAWMDPQVGKVRGARGDVFMEPSVLRLASHDFLAGIPANIGDRAGGPMTPEEAVFGSWRCKPLDLSRSAGDMRGIKLNHVNFEERKLSEHLLAEVVRIETSIRAGAVRPGRLTSQLKDELRKLGKCAVGGTRHISPTSFAWLVVLRRWTYPLVRGVLELGPELSTMAIGINAADPRQWQEVRDAAVRTSGDGCVADGDFSDYDLNRQLDMAAQEADIARELALRCGYSGGDADMVWACVWFGAFPLATVDGVVILFLQTRWSGEFATDFWNSVVCFLKLACAFYLGAARAGVSPPPRFRDTVGLVSVGDDHVYGAPPAVRGWFNSRAIAQALEPYGDVYTNADKTLDLTTAYKDARDASFLQRRFDDGLDLLRAPLEISRIARSHMLVRTRRDLADAILVDSITMNAQFELLMHGRAEFDAYQAIFPDGPLVLGDGSSFKFRRLDYDELMARWRDGRIVTWDSGGQVFRAEDGVLGELVGPVECTSDAVLLGGALAPMEGSTTAHEREGTDAVAAPAAGASLAPPPTIGSYADVMGRIVELGSWSLSAASTQTGGAWNSVQVLSAWAQIPAILRKISQFRLGHRLRLRLHVLIAATEQHRGAMVFAVHPMVTALRVGSAYIAPQSVQLPGSIVVNLRGRRTIELQAVVITQAGDTVVMDDNDSSFGVGGGPMWTATILSPLSHCSLTPPPAISITLRACLEGGSFSAPSDYSAYVVTMAPDNEASGVVSRPAAVIAQVASALAGAVPFLAPFLTPMAYIARGVGGIAQLLGFGRPQRRMPGMLMAPATNADLTSNGVEDPAPLLGVDVAVESSPYPGAGGWPEQDMMSLRSLERCWALVGGSSNTAEWTTALAKGALLMSIPVCPATCDAGSDASGGFVLHPCMLVGSSHQFWRGRARFKVVAFAGALDAGRLLVVHYPGSGRTNKALPPLMHYSALLDVSEASELEFVVDWNREGTYLQLPATFALLPSTQYGAQASSSSYDNGTVSIYVDGELTSNQTPTAVGVSVFVQWEDLVFARPTTRFLNTVQCTSAPDVPRVVGADAAYYAGGDGASHLRQLLTRYWPELRLSIGYGVASTSVSWIWAITIPVFGYIGPTVSTSQGVVGKAASAFDLALYCYVGVRGSVSRRFMPAGTAADSLPWVAVLAGPCGINQWTAYINVPVGPNSAGAATTAKSWTPNQACATVLPVWDCSGAAVYGRGQFSSGGGDFIAGCVPWRCANPWWLPWQMITASSGSWYGDCCSLVGTIQTSDTTNRPVLTQFESWRRFGDDVVLSGFCGMPIVSASAWTP